MASTQEQQPPPLAPPPTAFSDDARRWRAVQDRDAGADGLFVYAVKTTKIYCRPTCKARLARRANVRFYACGRAAQAAGFRACKRCRPELAGAMPEEPAVRKIRAFVEERRRRRAGGGAAGGGGGGARSLSEMARQTGLSKWHFHRVFKRCAGVTPSEFLRAAAGAGGQKAEEEEEEGGGGAALSSSLTSGTPSPWTDSNWGGDGAALDGLRWWGQGGVGDDDGQQQQQHEMDFALFDVEAAPVPPLLTEEEDGLAWDDVGLSLDDFLIWPEETFATGPV